MVKQRPGSRRGRTKFTGGAKKAARKVAGKTKGRMYQRDIVHPVLRSTWDKKLSASQNLERAGLQSSVNRMRKTKRRGRVIDVRVERMDVVGSQTLTQLETQASRPEAKAKQVVNPGEKLALTAMFEKHGDNWEAMARDIKLNYLQWNANQLQRKMQRMHRLLD